MIEEAVRQRGAPAGPDGRRTAGAGQCRRRRPPTPAPPRLRAPGVLELEQLLEAHLSDPGGDHGGRTRGKVVIEFADLEDLERIYHLINEPARPPE